LPDAPTEDAIQVVARAAGPQGHTLAALGSAGGGASVLGVFLLLQQLGVIQAPGTKPAEKGAAEIRREIAEEQARASLLERLQLAATRNTESLERLGGALSHIEESISDLEEEGKRAEAHIRSILDAEFNFMVSACLDGDAQRRKARRRRRPARGPTGNENNEPEEEE
jgi:hypothetical protein